MYLRIYLSTYPTVVVHVFLQLITCMCLNMCAFMYLVSQLCMCSVVALLMCVLIHVSVYLLICLSAMYFSVYLFDKLVGWIAESQLIADLVCNPRSTCSLNQLLTLAFMHMHLPVSLCIYLFAGLLTYSRSAYVFCIYVCSCSLLQNKRYTTV